MIWVRVVTVVGLLPQRCIHGHQTGVECAVCGTVWGGGGGGLRPCTPLVNPKFAYFGRNFLIAPFIFRRGKPLLMSNIQVNFGDILPETSKSSAFWDMGVDSHIKWLLWFSPNEVSELGRHQSMSP